MRRPQVTISVLSIAAAAVMSGCAWAMGYTAVAALIGGGALAGAAAFYCVSRYVLAPIGHLTECLSRIAAGEAAVRARPPAGLALPRVCALVSAFNAMAGAVDVKRTDEAVLRQRAETENARKTEFLHAVTHELRSPVNALVGFADLLRQARYGPLGAPEYDAYVGDIHAASRLLLSLVNDLLDLSKIEAGHYTLHEADVGLDEIIGRACRFVMPAAQSRAMTIAVDCPDRFPALHVDERAFVQIVLNLASNAVRYGNPGGRISIAAGRTEAGGMVLRVIDDGPGIPEADLGRVLEPFQRVESIGHRVEGTGLGLTIVKRLVELHGGGFLLESQVGIGTQARIELPPERVVSAAPARARTVPVAA